MKRNLSSTTIKELQEEIKDIKMLIEGKQRDYDDPTLPITLLPHSPLPHSPCVSVEEE